MSSNNYEPYLLLGLLTITILACSISGTMGSALHGPCDNDDACGTIDTECQNGVCVCRENFTVLYDSCVPMAESRVHCTKKNDCHKVLGVKSTCTKKNQCVCKQFHHLHLGQCVKNRDLHETCDHDHQCYCGVDCQLKIACIHKNCSCKAGHSPYKSRRCISDQQLNSVIEEPRTEEFNLLMQNDGVPRTSIDCYSFSIFLILTILY
ncbi:hypothetical protein ABEB36_006319 [Hypothenemus hampei]|uniref:Uncharacterized protein n=1 Tax=Hypothenemus hampei TaxID=57062 RepID=A0ABD1EQL1_HYPHA